MVGGSGELMLGAEKRSSVKILEWYIMAVCATFAALT
jgi:hypothetical protein